MVRTYRLLAFVAALGAPLVSAPAHAGISDCGEINVEANETCTAEVGGGCTAKCTPVSFEAACHGQLEASCAGQCNVTPPSCDVSCQGTCEGSCKGSASFTCQGDCETTCEGTCSGKCSAMSNSAECEGSCKATCQSECSAQCSGMAQADCSGKCQASCQGSCNAQANMDCQIQCQSQGYLDCQTQLQGGCTANCTRPEGALFCDGNFVDDGGHLAQCEQAIKDFIAAHFQASASGSADCSGNTCQAQGQASCKCSRIAPTDATNTQAFTIAGLAAASILARRRVRRR